MEPNSGKIELAKLASSASSEVSSMLRELEGGSDREEHGFNEHWPTRFVSAGAKGAPQRWPNRFISAGPKEAPTRR